MFLNINLKIKRRAQLAEVTTTDNESKFEQDEGG